MRSDAIYSEEYGCFIAPPQIPIKKVIRFDITKCIIKISKFGFFSLWINDKKLQDLNFKEYRKYKPYVLEVQDECYRES